MTNQEAKALATEIVGDGKTPNMFFVTSSPYYNEVDEFGDRESQLLDGFDNNSSSETRVFDTYEEAEAYYNDVDLDIYDGVGSVMIEDRLTGTITEKSLEKIIKVDYILTEHSDAKLFGYKK
jgi:hypothetical protein